jgi:GNAT superfamily N-acetyltransferase
MPLCFIKARDTWPLRHKVLRPHQALEDCDLPNDRNPDSFHLAVMKDEVIACIGSFYKENNPDLKGWKQYRLRGMATEPELQGQGLGAQLIHFALDHLRAQNADLLWCNARETAMPFYRILGFTTHGDAFEITGIGPHYLLSIKL